MDKILEGIRVIDTASWIAGPFGAAILADLGAEVIRVEPPGGSIDRKLGITLPNKSNIIFGVALQRNKKEVTLQLASEEGMDILRELIKKSDVLIHNYPLGTRMEENLRYESLKEINPRIIVAGVSGFGKTGPYARRVCYDSIAQAMGGGMSITGFPENPPTRSSLGYVDCGTGVYTALGVIAALYHRQITGVGQEIDISMFDACCSFTGVYGIGSEYKYYGYLRPRVGNYTLFTFSSAFKAKDGWVQISAIGNSIWRRLAKAMGRDDLIEDTRFKDDFNRFQNREALEAIVTEWTGGKTRAEVTELLEEARVPGGPVNFANDVVEDPQIKARQMLVDVEVPRVGKVLAPGVALKFSAAEGEIKEVVSDVGGDNEEIYCGLLGLSKEQVQQLKEKEVI